MKKKELIKIIKDLRKEQTILNKKYNNNNIWVSIGIEASPNEIMEVNPFSLNLKTGEYFGRDLIDGYYKKVNFFK